MSNEPTPAPISPVDAGHFGVWLREFRASLQGRGGIEVPCGECVGCCVSSYSILLRPQDTAALASVPARWLQDVPGLGVGVKAMGYLPDGTCPMLQAKGCSIYSSRPETCRDYDCRVFAAAGLLPPASKPVIEARVRAWCFSYTSDTERLAHQAIRTAAAFLRDQGPRFPEHRWPTNPSGIAVLAVKCYEVFLPHEPRSQAESDVAAAVVAALREFDAGCTTT